MIQTNTNDISKLEIWILAARPKTLLAAFVPVIIGSSIAFHDNKFNWLAFVFALISAILIQAGTNFVNDLYDFLHGTDKKERLGPPRALASGFLSVREMKYGIVAIFTAAFLFGLYLVHLGGLPILAIGILSIIAGILYTAGPFPFAYNSLGDIFVFLFFGFIGTAGTYYVHTQQLTYLVFWASVPVGALITNILVVNNYRDRNEDRINGKNTLAVKFGERFTRFQYFSFMILSYLIPMIVYFTFKKSLLVFLPMITIPLSVKLIKMIYTLEGRELNKTLELTAKLSLIYGLLFAIGILL
ncbi:MAG: 1,4-dihydroxy-2-naphthoate polyprenyltransferase [bacterium]